MNQNYYYTESRPLAAYFLAFYNDLYQEEADRWNLNDKGRMIRSFAFTEPELCYKIREEFVSGPYKTYSGNLLDIIQASNYDRLSR